MNLIREVPHRTRLLVVDRDTDDLLRSRGLACTEDLAIEMGTLSPRPSPGPTPSTSPLPRGSSPQTPKPNHTLSFHPLAAESPTNTTTQGKAKRSSVTSSTGTDTEVRLDINTSDSFDQTKMGDRALTLKLKWGAVSQCYSVNTEHCFYLTLSGTNLEMSSYVICWLDSVPKQCSAFFKRLETSLNKQEENCTDLKCDDEGRKTVDTDCIIPEGQSCTRVFKLQ